MEGLLDFGVTSLAEPFTLHFPFKIYVCDVLSCVRPVHAHACIGAELAELLPARGLLHSLIDRHADFCEIGFDLTSFVLGKDLVGVLIPSGCLLAVFALEGLAFLRDGQPFPLADLVG